MLEQPTGEATATLTRADVRYKVVELTVVTDEEIERALNEHVARGWVFERIAFAMWEGSRRPSMAFLFFVQGSSGA